MKITGFVSAVALMMSSATAFAGGEVGPVGIDTPQPVVVAPPPPPPPPGPVAAAPVEAGPGVPWGLLGLGALAAAGIAIILLDDDDDDDTNGTIVINGDSD